MDTSPERPKKHLLKAIQSNDPVEKNFHIRQALQLLSVADMETAELAQEGDISVYDAAQ